jgi:hypothetical protein
VTKICSAGIPSARRLRRAHSVGAKCRAASLVLLCYKGCDLLGLPA